jgi:HEAT repeat protein
MIVQLLRQSLRPDDHTSLLIAARWAVLAPADAGWRKNVMKALAQIFAQPGIGSDYRIAVGQALALVAGESALPFYLQVLKHPSAAVRSAALRGVGWTGGPKQMRALASGLNDEDFDVRVSAVRGLGDLGTPGALRFLKDHLVKADEELMLIIAEVLAERPEGGEALKEATQADDLLVRRAAVHGLGQIDAPWPRDVLKRVLREDSQWLVRSAAEAALSQEGEEEAARSVPAPPKVDEAQWLITWAAQQGLGVGLDEAAMQMLLRALEVGDVPTRVVGAQTLSQIGHQEHLSALRPLLNDENEAVREAAQLAVTSIEARYQGISAAESQPDEAGEVKREQQPESEST